LPEVASCDSFPWLLGWLVELIEHVAMLSSGSLFELIEDVSH
jgi:hypothetical protein